MLQLLFLLYSALPDKILFHYLSRTSSGKLRHVWWHCPPNKEKLGTKSGSDHSKHGLNHHSSLDFQNTYFSLFQSKLANFCL